MSELCEKCNLELYGKPKILVLDSILCYRCAKIEVNAEKNRKLDNQKAEYAILIAAFDKRRSEINDINSKWWQNKFEFINKGRLGFWQKFFIILALSIIINFNNPGNHYGLWSFLILSIIMYVYSKKIDEHRSAIFESSNPEPPRFNETKPIFEPDDFVEFEILSPDDSPDIPRRGLRDEIIKRDKLTCQICGSRKQKKNLEVHHIIPLSNGGIDHPTNLITLCLHCHDRENWFGHKRKFPTTIKQYHHLARRYYR